MRRRLRIIRIVEDFAPKPISECRVLDIACLEGGYSAEFAMRGAEVVGIEGRLTNVQRAQDKFSLPNLTFAHDDVRNISREKYGEFDIVLCLGILYHLDSPDCFTLLDAIGEVCTGTAVIDTHVAIEPLELVEHNGRDYHGLKFVEYEQEPSAEEVESSRWASIGNRHSFWMTKPSLTNALVAAGFTSVYDSAFPAWNDIPADRSAFVARKGSRPELLNNDFDHAFSEDLLTEFVDETPRVPAVSSPQPPSLTQKIARRLKMGRSESK